MERSDLHKDVEYRILQSEGIVFTPIPDLEDSASSEYRTFMDRQYAREIAEQLAHILMKELVRGGDFFQYFLASIVGSALNKNNIPELQLIFNNY